MSCVLPSAPCSPGQARPESPPARTSVSPPLNEAGRYGWNTFLKTAASCYAGTSLNAVAEGAHRHPAARIASTRSSIEERGLKGRSPKSVRKVPIPPQLVRILREHIARFGTTADGRLFRSERGSPIQPSTWWQVWQKVRNLALTPEQLATPLMKRPYDLRHAGITWRLNSGVPAPDVAKWAGHSVEVLTRVYAGCVAGLDEVWIARMPDRRAQCDCRIAGVHLGCRNRRKMAHHGGL